MAYIVTKWLLFQIVPFSVLSHMAFSRSYDWLAHSRVTLNRSSRLHANCFCCAFMSWRLETGIDAKTDLTIAGSLWSTCQAVKISIETTMPLPAGPRTHVTVCYLDVVLDVTAGQQWRIQEYWCPQLGSVFSSVVALHGRHHVYSEIHFSITNLGPGLCPTCSFYCPATAQQQQCSCEKVSALFLVSQFYKMQTNTIHSLWIMILFIKGNNTVQAYSLNHNKLW